MPSILIVDDEPEIRSLLTDLVTELGYQVDAAVDGADALERVAARAPDLVLLDVDMPRMRGGETLAALRQVLPSTNVIMISGRARPEEARRAIALGAFDYIGKPFDLQYLERAIRLAIL